ncbi:MAG: hypothetical protein ACM3UZ_01620 [Acidobacteriota bacterium]
MAQTANGTISRRINAGQGTRSDFSANARIGTTLQFAGIWKGPNGVDRINVCQVAFRP